MASLVSPVLFTIEMYPYTGTTSYTLTPTNGTGSYTGTLSSGSETIPVLPGAYSLALTAPGYVSLTTQVNTTNPYYGGSLVKLSDSTAAPISTSNLSNSQTTAIAVAAAPPSAEFVNPSSQYGRYFMSSDARLYIGNLFIDELSWVQFVLQDNKVPVYAYQSRFFSAMAQGRSLIQGQLGINFVSEGYLYTALRNYFDNFASEQVDPAQEELNNLVAQQALLTTPNSNSNAVTSSNTLTASPSAQSTLIGQRITALVSTLGASSLDIAKNYAKKTSIVDFNTTDATFCNAVYQGGPFDISINLTGPNGTAIRQLESCFLISNEMIISPDGKVIGESYGFVARRCR